LWIALGLLLAAAAVSYWVWLHPWLAAPDEPVAEIDRRWARVVAWARPAGEPGPAGERLAAALEAMEPVAGELDERVAALDDGRLPVLAAASLPAAARRALDELVGWWRAGGGLPQASGGEPQAGGGEASVCPQPLAAMELLTLGRLALVTAPDDAGSERVAAALGLAHTLWTRGRLIELAVGAQLARETAEWLVQRGLAPGPAFERLLPEAEGVFAGLARDAVCTYRDTARQLTGGQPPGDTGPFFSVERELLWLRKMLADRLHGAAPVRAELEQLAERFSYRPPDQLPASHLVRLIYPSPLGKVVDKLREHLEAIDQALQRARQNPASGKTAPGGDAVDPADAADDGEDADASDAADATEEADALDAPHEAAAAQRDTEPDGAPAGAGSADAAAPPGPLRGVQRLDATRFRIERRAFAASAGGMQGLTAGIRVVPSFEQGQARGLKLHRVQPGTAAAQLGMKTGDTLLRLAGQPLASPKDAAAAAEACERSERVELELIRAGQALTITYLLE
jgi:hypothetical protein